MIFKCRRIVNCLEEIFMQEWDIKWLMRHKQKKHNQSGTLSKFIQDLVGFIKLDSVVNKSRGNIDLIAMVDEIKTTHKTFWKQCFLSWHYYLHTHIWCNTRSSSKIQEEKPFSLWFWSVLSTEEGFERTIFPIQ